MQLKLTFLDRTPFRSCAAVTLGIWAASTVVSIAVSQIFLLVSGALFIFGWLRKLHPIRFPPILLPVSAFVITTFVSLLLSPDPAQGTASIRKLVLFLSILLVASVFRNSTEIARVLAGIVIISAMAALLSFWQLAENLRTVGAMERTYKLNAPEAYSYFIYGKRTTGFMSHWMTFAGEQMLVFSMMTSLLLFSPYVRKKLWWVSYVLIGVSLILSCVRSAWLGALVALGFLLYLKAKKWLICLPLLILVLSFVLPWEVVYRGRTVFDLSGKDRLFQWRTGWSMIKTHPWQGVGPNRISKTFDQYKPQGEPTPPGWHGHLHNNFIQFAAERGIPCMIAWCWLMGTWGYRLLRLGRIQTDSFEQALCWGGCACVLALVAAGLFEFNFGDSEVLMLFLFLGTVPFVLPEDKTSTPF